MSHESELKFANYILSKIGEVIGDANGILVTYRIHADPIDELIKSWFLF